VFYHKYFTRKHERQNVRPREFSRLGANPFDEGTDEQDERSNLADEKSDFDEDEIWMVGDHQTILCGTILN
jgi:hypothetical protein